MSEVAASESHKWGALCLGFVLLALWAAPAVLALDCALDVDAENGSAVAYKAREDRCEGVYDQPVANRINLRIAGFHRDAPVFDPHTDLAVRITVQPHEAGREVLLRVISTRRHGFFQMDTTALLEDGSFIWRLDVVRLMDDPLRPFDTAALACTGECEVGRSMRATLLPVSFSRPGADSERPPSALTVLAVADVELSSLTATLRQGDKIIFEDLRVGGRYLPPHMPIRIPIDGVEAGEAVLALSGLTLQEYRDYVEAVLLIPEEGM